MLRDHGIYFGILVDSRKSEHGNLVGFGGSPLKKEACWGDLGPYGSCNGGFTVSGLQKVGTWMSAPWKKPCRRYGAIEGHIWLYWNIDVGGLMLVFNLSLVWVWRAFMFLNFVEVTLGASATSSDS